MELYQQGNYAQAVPYLRSAVESDPELFPRKFYLGITLLMTNQNDEAIQNLLSLVKSTSNPYIEESHWYLAKAYFRKKDIQSGKEQLEAVAGLNGSHAQEARKLLERLRETGNE